jgi:quercetin dioxygenase-like cupin family protein
MSERPQMIQKLAALEHFGLIRARRQYESFAISISRYAPYSSTPPHSNENALLGFVLSGAYSKDVGRKNGLHLERGSFFFIPAGQCQADAFGPSTDCLLVDCAPQFIRRLPVGLI